jgi:hypothetical protein
LNSDGSLDPTEYLTDYFSIDDDSDDTEESLASIEIIGSGIVDEDGRQSYQLLATYDDETTEYVTADSWGVSNNSIATISGGGTLVTESVSSNKEIDIIANYNDEQASREILIVDNDETYSQPDETTTLEKYTESCGTDGTVWVTYYRPSGTTCTDSDSRSYNVADLEDSYDGNLIVENGTLDLEGETLIVEGDLTLNGGTINLDGGNLLVFGDLIESGGTLNVNAGTLKIGGDYRIQSVSGDDYTYSSGILKMTNASDYITVGGDFFTDSYISHSLYLTAGTLEIKGDFSQLRSNTGSDKDNYNFYAKDDHRVLLSGSSEQIVSFSTATSTTSHFNILEITNSSADGVVFDGDIAMAQLTSNGNTLNSLQINGMDWTLTEDTAFSGTLTLKGSTINLGVYKLAFAKGVSQSGGTLNLASGDMSVGGGYTQSAGTLYGNGGALDIAGDYRIQTVTTDSDDTDGYTYSSGILKMTNASDHITVGGDFVTDSYISHSLYLTAGTLEIQGDFSQLRSNTGSTNDNYNFYAQTDHRVLLSGSSEQIVSFSTATSTTSHFNILEITNSSADGVVFDGDIAMAQLTSNGNTLNSLQINGMDWTLTEDTAFSGTLTLKGSTINLGGYKLTFAGDASQSGGTLNLAGGEMTVGGGILRVEEPCMAMAVLSISQETIGFKLLKPTATGLLVALTVVAF